MLFCFVSAVVSVVVLEFCYTNNSIVAMTSCMRDFIFVCMYVCVYFCYASKVATMPGPFHFEGGGYSLFALWKFFVCNSSLWMHCAQRVREHTMPRKIELIMNLIFLHSIHKTKIIKNKKPVVCTTSTNIYVCIYLV